MLPFGHLLFKQLRDKIVQDTSTVNETVCKKAHESFQVIRTLPMTLTLAIFQGHKTVSHQIYRKRCVNDSHVVTHCTE